MWIATGLLGVHYLLATFLAFFVVNPIGFFLNRGFTYDAAAVPWRSQIFRYHWAMAGSLIITLTLVAIFVDILGIHYLAATLISMALMTIMNYLAHEFWSLRTGGGRH